MTIRVGTGDCSNQSLKQVPMNNDEDASNASTKCRNISKNNVHTIYIYTGSISRY